METTEKIVEAYVRYVKGWATIANIRCKGQYEIDLLAIDPKTGDRYHMESGVSISGSFSRLKNQPYSKELEKDRVKKPAQRRTLGYFIHKKFENDEVVKTLKEYGFHSKGYKRIIVTWGWTDGAKADADKLGIELWDFRDLMVEIADRIKDKTAHLPDDTLRTLQLYVLAQGGGQPDRK